MKENNMQENYIIGYKQNSELFVFTHTGTLCKYPCSHQYNLFSFIEAKDLLQDAKHSYPSFKLSIYKIQLIKVED